MKKMVLLALMLASITACISPEERAIKKAVIEANQAQYRLYQEPTDLKRLKEAEKHYAMDGPALSQTMQLIANTAAHNSKVIKSEPPKIRVKNISITGNWARVDTRETWMLCWSSGLRHRQKNNPHIYKLSKAEGTWKIVTDQWKQQFPID